MTLKDLFDIAADAFEAVDTRFEKILEAAGAMAAWYWVIGPQRGRPRRLALRYGGLWGRSILDAGYVFAPYVPLHVTPVAPDLRARTGGLARFTVHRNENWRDT